ncbi:hypothetical protein [Bremerella sp. P1]|uniref:hypothetical protein n=1 Tax=Bremerella sp. P1 TaxID=3026424 RepID=UPI002368C577|nr:hypothetical protein [Bremerella sp. P1]WDI45114.1 hypothetical protein PSR63_14350 [Bremerella sp. P1]
MGFWNLLADVDAIELLIRIGVVVIFMVGPYLLQLLGGKAVQDDRGQRRRREPQSDLEREIQEFLEQSRGGGSTSSSRVPAQSADEYHEEEFVAAESAHESLRDHHLESTIDTTHPEPERHVEKQPYATDLPVEPAVEENHYESETFSYDTEATTSSSDAGAAIAAMFRDPTQVRNAFILGEIMNRPQVPRR